MIKRRLTISLIALLALGITQSYGHHVHAQAITLFGTAKPQNPIDPDANSVTLGVQFYSAQAGTIAGVRFYRASRSSNGYSVGIFNASSGARLAFASKSKEPCASLPCWEQITFSSPLSISANKTYVAAYFVSGGHYAGDTNYFTNQVVSGPLTAPATGAAIGGNGVYIYGSSLLMPNSTYQASNYYVDVSFTPSTPPPPNLVMSFSPAAPAIPDTSPIGTNVAAVNVDWSDDVNGSHPFAGTIGFAQPYSNDAGAFGLSGNSLMVSSSLGNDGGTTQNVTIQAIQSTSSVAKNLPVQVTHTSTQTPISVSFSPPGPVGVVDNAAQGTPLAGINVVASDGNPYAGSVAISAQSAAGMTSISSTTLPSNVQVASISPADDGPQTVSVQACENGTCSSAAILSVTVNPPSSSGGDPTVGLLPSNRDAYSSWSAAGLRSIGGAPNRTTIFKTLSPSGGDDTSAIQASLDACPSEQVVQLTTGIFHINGNGLNFHTSNCTLRGAGPGDPSLNTGINTVQAGNPWTLSCASQSSANSILCPDPSATQLVKADRATNTNYGVLYVQPTGSWGFGGNSTNLAVDATQGATSLTLATWPTTGINVGDHVLVDINTDNYPDVVWGPVFGPPGDGTRRWFSRQDRSISQIMEVAAVNSSSKTVTFNTPFRITFPVAYQAQLTQSGAPFVKNVGIENLFLWGGMGGDGHGDLAMWDCAYCWVKNVQAMWANGTAIGFYQTFRSELRDSYIHESSWPNPGGGGYLTGLNTGASDNLFENNIMWYGNKEVVMRGTGGGNVLGYNYMDDSFDNGSAVISSEAGANAGHYTTPHMELLEGNYSQNYKGDSYWGNSIYITTFRNQFSGLRAAHPPLKNYVVVQGNCHYPYGDWVGRQAVDVQAYTLYGSFVGNVLGFDGQALLTEPYVSESCFNGIQRGWLEQVTTGAQTDSADNQDDVIMWRFGAYQAGGWTFVDSTINTQLRQGNWDWVTQKQHWYGIGGTTDGSGSSVSIPNSFYLTARPAFFGTSQWPWVDPATGTTYTLPAKYCFEHNMMPTCLQ